MSAFEKSLEEMVRADTTEKLEEVVNDITPHLLHAPEWTRKVTHWVADGRREELRDDEE